MVGPAAAARAVLVAIAALTGLVCGCGKASRIAGSAQTCTSCHGVPPGGSHPQVAADLRGCWVCHPGTIDSNGALLAGGQHRDGRVETFSGHAAGFASPDVHGRDFFAFLAGGGLPCTVCHGADYATVVGGGKSCDGCHAAAGWQTSGAPSWQANCSFCHGVRNTTTQAGYTLADHPAWAAPPDGLAQRLGGAADARRTGAHQVHLIGSDVAGPLPCASCHEVPSSLAHVRGRDARARVVVTPPRGAADPLAYDPATRTCATACHGAARSPAWEATGLACDGCHGTPPATAVHAAVAAGDLVACTGCHAATVTAAGTVDVAGGRHLDGAVEVASRHPAGYGGPDGHGREFFAAVAAAGTGGTPACATCHGATFGSPIVAGGTSCNGCHAALGWTGWPTNCSFCHGVRNATTRAGYAVADHPTWAAPPSSVSQRLTGTAEPARTGAHAVHLTGGALAGPIACGACHAVPTTMAHIGGRDLRAAVALTSPGQVALPDPDGYDTVAQTCATACHGASRSPAWSTTGIACDGCHAVPPATTAHAGLSPADLSACATCHPDTVTVAGAVDVPGGRHVNGVVDTLRHPDGFAAPAAHGPAFLDRLAGVAGSVSCKAYHGADYGLAVAGQSCNGCHAAAGWATAGVPSWQTNCSFCHGARDATTQAGYDVATILTAAAPPDAVSERLTGTPAPTRTGAHAVHLTGKGTAYPPFPCATCHPVPATLSHVSASRRATVTFDPAAVFTTLTAEELARLPASLATYDASGATPVCGNNYCHGATLAGRAASASQFPPRWSPAAPAIGTGDCTTCHGHPPDTGQHLLHTNYGIQCETCHDGVRHVSGKPEVRFAPGTTATFWYPPVKTCTAACHLDLGYGPTDELGWQ